VNGGSRNGVHGRRNVTVLFQAGSISREIAVAGETVTLELLSRQQLRILDEMQLLRADVKELRQENLLIRDDI
jgi:hypothetical protein